MEKWKRIGISLLYVIAYFISSLIASVLVLIVLLPMFFTTSRGTPFDMIEQLTSLSVIPVMLITSLLMIGAILLTQKLRHLSFRELGFRKFKLGGALIAGIMALGLMAVVTGFAGIFDSFFSQLMPVETAESINAIATMGGPIVGILIIGIVGPLAEEIIMRGAVYPELRKGFSFWPAALISALLFGFIHLNLLQGMVGFSLGIILAYLVYKTQSI